MIHTANRHSLLPLDKGEPNAKFQNERFHFSQDGGLKVLFGIAVLEPEKSEDIGIAENQVGRKAVLIAERGKLFASELLRLFR